MQFNCKQNDIDIRFKDQITKICITGGPCAGKTTAITELSIKLTQMGFKVLICPESANIMKKGGAINPTSEMSFI